MKKWFARLGLVLALPLLLVLVAALWIGFKYVSYDQSDDAIHLSNKADYLKTIASTAEQADATQRPNIVLIMYDDLGYGDLSMTGSLAVQTPEIDKLGANGVVLHNFYSAAPVCTPARAGLLTGRLPPRAGLPNVVFPTGSRLSMLNILSGGNVRLPAEEITVADVLKAAGYRTGMIGKWHIGDRAPSLPNNFGFDSYYGSLYSNDMKPFALYRNDKIELNAPVDQTKINDLYTGEAVRFVNAKSSDQKPFFLYFAHNFPHEPLFTSAAQKGKSRAGLYGDVMADIDRGVGEIVEALRAQDALDNTIIIITSDNGPWFEGSSGPFRGRKGKTFEGGVHVPFIVHWPASLSAGQQIDAMAMGTDILPTVLDLLKLPAPKDRIIDGKSMLPMLTETGTTPHEYLYFYAGERLMAVSDGRFKYHDERNIVYAPGNAAFGFPNKKGPWLFDLNLDPDESYNVLTKYPKITAKLSKAMAIKREEMTKNKRGWK